MVSSVLRRVVCLFLVVGSALFAGSVAGAAEPEGKTLSPYFFVEEGDPSVDRLPLKATDVRVAINGVIADVVIRQRYANEGVRPINARYIFPASTRAAVHGMKMTVGDQVVIAKIKEKEAAKKEFEEAKRAGKSASLLSQHRPNVFSMSVANIMPKDIIDLELHYTELLVPTEGIYEFVYPTVVGPRYSNQPQERAPEDDLWVASPYLKENTPPNTNFTISATIAAGMALQDISCPSHDTEVRFENPSTARISLKGAEQAGGNRDFILRYRLAGKKVQSGLMLFDGGEEKFFLLMVQPPQRVRPEDVPPREYIFVVDVSGSMHGYPLEVSKELLGNLIGSLRRTDKFNVILFSGGSRLMSPVSLPATPEHIQGAIRVIEEQRGGGGTELLAALNRALDLPRNESVSRTVLVITDGYIDAEREVFTTIRKNLSRTNVFAFGIGTSVNRYLIEGIAKAGLGEPFVVTRQQEAPETARRFARYVQSPVLRDVRLKFDGFAAFAVEPGAIPDLFADRPLAIIGKWQGKAEGTVRVTGAGGSGTYSQEFSVSDIKPLASNSALRYLWARERIAHLSDLNFGPEDPKTREEVTALGLTYSLLTKYTSFIAVHEVVRNQEGQAREVNQPLPLPQGVSNLAVGESCSQVPEPEMTLMLVILAILGAAALAYRTVRVRVRR
jgi:Ca-activated chloride channel family protein